MKHLLLTIIPTIFIGIFLFTSCSKHEDHETVNPYDDVKARDASYRSQLMDYSIEELIPDRCDRLTFYALYSAFVTWQDLSGYEWNDGEWHRDVRACYPDASKSEISFDGLIGVLHYAQTTKNSDLLTRLIAYGEMHKWVMGEGDREITYIPQLKIITADMLTHFNMLEMRPPYSLSDGTHNEHIIALSAWLKLRYAGYLESHDLLVLENLKQNPLIKAIRNRVDNGDQSEIIEYLNSFPDALPLDTGIEQWGSAPDWLYWFLVYAVVEGK